MNEIIIIRSHLFRLLGGFDESRKEYINKFLVVDDDPNETAIPIGFHLHDNSEVIKMSEKVFEYYPKVAEKIKQDYENWLIEKLAGIA